ncbi:hypothetical protein Tco_0519350 [Tanacetum coccineum]
MRMEQYLQCIDYTIWEIVENGNAPIVTKTVNGKETVIPPTSVEEKTQRRVELKAISTLLMALPNEHQLKSYALVETVKETFDLPDLRNIKDGDGDANSSWSRSLTICSCSNYKDIL